MLPPFALAAGRRKLVEQFVTVDPYRFDPASARAAFASELQDIEARGLVPVVSHERLCGNPHGGGRDGRAIGERLAQTFPEARVLVVVREQRSMLVSTYRQYVKIGGPASLARYVESRGHRVFGFDLRHLEYDRLIAHYVELFGRDAVCVLPFELLLRDPEAYVGAVAAHVGRTVARRPDTSPRNPGQAAVATALARRVNQLFVRNELSPAPLVPVMRSGRRATTLAARAEHLVPQRVLDRLERRVEAEAAAVVGHRFAESNRRTSALTGLDLGAYGYDVGPAQDPGDGARQLG